MTEIADVILNTSGIADIFVDSASLPYQNVRNYRLY